MFQSSRELRQKLSAQCEWTLSAKRDQTSCRLLRNVGLRLHLLNECICLFSPLHLHVCSQDRVGCGGHIWVCVPREVSLPGLPRVSSCGGPTPGPRCPAEGYNAGAGALRGLGGIRQDNKITHTHAYRDCWFC